VTTDATHAAEPGREGVGRGAPDPRSPDTDVLPIFAASAAAAGFGPPPALPAPLATDPSAAAPESAGREAWRPWNPDGQGRRLFLAGAAALVLALVLAGYLLTTTRAYQQRAAWGESKARVIGTDLATTRNDLQGATAELEAVRAQLTTARARITALADEKAQVGDDREAQRQLVDYQQRVSKAAGTVASALEQCVQGQDTLIGYLNNPGAYTPAQLTAYGTQVNGLCRSATDANKSLQDELAR
jgi:hypothetical protein